MGQSSDPLNRPGADPLGEEALTDTTLIEETGPQPANVYAEPSGSADVAFATTESWTSEPAVTDIDEDTGDDDIETHRAQIEQTRSEMSQTIDAIQERLSPGNIAEQAKEAVRGATVGKAQDVMSSVAGTAQDVVSNATAPARDFGSGIWETIRQNPVPAALAGIGIGWLLVSGRKSGTQTYTGSRAYAGMPGYRPRQYSYGRTDYSVPGRYSQYGEPSSREYTGTGSRGYRPTYAGGYATDGTDTGGPGITDRMSDVAGQAQGTAGQYVGQAQDLAGQAMNSAQETASQVAGTVQNTAGQMANQVQGAAQGMVEGAQYGVQQAQSGFQQMLQSNPLAVAAGAVALGIAVGLAIPETEKENELLGPTRDALMDQAQQTVQEKAQQVQSVAQQAVGAARDAAQQAADEKGLTS